MIRVGAYQAAENHDIHVVLQQSDELDFVCFPECYLTGYYADKDLAWKHSLSAEELQSWLPEIAHYKPTLIIGFNERAGDDLFNSVAIIEKGDLLGIQRKHYLYHDYFTPGTTFTSFESKGVRFGVIICLDANYIEPSRLLALQEASIIFCPMCNRVPIGHPYAKRPAYYSHFVARSHENRCWLVSADWVFPEHNGTICPGHTAIYDPDGQEVARSHELTPELLTYNIPKETLHTTKGKRLHGSPALMRQLV